MEVVNFENAVPPILDRLMNLGIKAKPSFTTDDCVEKFAKSYVDEASNYVLTHLRNIFPMILKDNSMFIGEAQETVRVL